MAKIGLNIYKRKDGRYEGRIMIGYKENGKAKYNSVYGHSFEEVHKKIESIRSAMSHLLIFFIVFI